MSTMIKPKHLLLGAVSLAALLLFSPQTTLAATAKKDAGKLPYDMEKIVKKLMNSKRLSPNKTMYLDIFLKPQNQSNFNQEIYNVNTPGNGEFKHFYTPAHFRATFGQPAKVTGEFKPYLAKYHLKTHVFANGLIIGVSGKVKNINRAFATNLKTAKYHKNPVQFSKQRPKLPAKLADNVLTVLGITNYSQKSSPLAKKKQPKTKVSAKYAPSKFIDHYNLSPLYAQGAKGQGQTLGIITFAGFHKRDAEHFWKAEHIATKPNRLSTKKITANDSQISLVNQLAGPVETTLDVEQSGAVAPQANIRVYESKFNDLGLINSFVTAFDENKASSLSMSWGINEYITRYLKNVRFLNPVYGQVMSLVMGQGALQGVSTFIASGDYGAYGLGRGGTVAGIPIPNVSQYATFPADNPWVTTTGGTTLPFKKNFGHGVKVNIKNERAWGGDYMFNAFFKVRSHLLENLNILSNVFAGGGGGISHLYATPQYQENVPGVNTFNAREYLSNLLQPRRNPVLLSGTDYGRNYPDISADADPLTGYQIYFSGSWGIAGGTSVVAPQFNGAAAVINGAKGQRSGFWNPQLYALAQDKDKTPFTVLDSTTDNSNLYYVGQPGKLYNQATGLGTVNFEKLYQGLQ